MISYSLRPWANQLQMAVRLRSWNSPQRMAARVKIKPKSRPKLSMTFSRESL
ncbi:MAG TPA: hypothetical protein PLU87_05460 [Sedimentisphaerales bacterium]|nr:hypothetical protein [Sedimentisphaerales bacterium]HRV49005.1 hypothetical protein [Sedimentisphaerales bacterium]